MSESDNDQLNSTANPRINPSRFIPLDQAESNPNVSVSGFIDEYPYSGLLTPQTLVTSPQFQD